MEHICSESLVIIFIKKTKTKIKYLQYMKRILNPLDAKLFFCQTPVGARLIFGMLLLGAELIFAKLPPGAGLFFESEKRRDPRALSCL